MNKLSMLIDIIEASISQKRYELEHSCLETAEIWFTEGELSALVEMRETIKGMIDETEDA